VLQHDNSSVVGGMHKLHLSTIWAALVVVYISSEHLGGFLVQHLMLQYLLLEVRQGCEV
jgi:hypothetical protein